MNASKLQAAFGNAIRALRKQRGHSQEQLAERSHLHRTYISDVERGTRNLSLQSMARLAEALEVPLAELFPPPPGPSLE